MAVRICSVLLTLTLILLKTMTNFAEAASIDVLFAAGEKITADQDGTLKFMEGIQHQLRLHGNQLANITAIAFTTESADRGEVCVVSDGDMKVNFSEVIDNSVGVISVSFDYVDGEYRYVCVKEIFMTSGFQNETQTRWVHQGRDSPWLRFTVEAKPVKEFLLPIGLQISILIVLLCLSGLFSGLNLGLMALDKTELQIIQKCGSDNEKKYAKIIEPLRSRGNFLLCTLLLGNVLVNNTLTILLDDLSNGLLAIIMSTMGIVIFGEIIPQAICSRHGLAIGARTVYLTKFFMIVTFPLSFPISLILDKVLGEEIGQVYNKEKLQELIRMTADSKVLQNDEANIIAGALQLANKVVTDVMTKIDDVYMLDINTTLDFETMSEILKNGYTRIPVFDGDKSCIVNLLNTKDLALIDPDDNTALKTVCQFYDHRPLFVDEDYKLDSMLQDFLQGNSHMAIVQLLHNDSECDPYYEITGVVTLEDVIEEILQSEIVDETDILSDNKKKAPRRHEKRDYSVFDQNDDESAPRISPQLALATFQFLTTTVDAFNEEVISRNVLKRLIRQNIVVNIHPTDPPSDKNYIYKQGKECDYFVLILQGHAEALIGKEQMVFEAGPFTYFGVDTLKKLKDNRAPEYHHAKNEKYIPDFSLRAVTDMQYIRIRRAHYLAARRTTSMMKKIRPDQAKLKEEEAFSKEWKQALNASLSRNNSAANITDLNCLDNSLKRALTDEVLNSDVMIESKPRSKSELEESRSQNSDGFSPKAIRDLKMKSSSFDDLPPKHNSRHNSIKLDQAALNQTLKFRNSNSEIDSIRYVDEEKTPLMNTETAQISPTSL